MLRLSEFRYDHAIEAEQVWLAPGKNGDHIRIVPLTEAMAEAAALGLSLIQEGPTSDGETPHCRFGVVAVPVQWEQTEIRDATEFLDEELWFDAPCGGRDFLLPGGPHTFPGRMAAWCPAKRVTYRVSLVEMGAMSTAAVYFVRGFLSGNEPEPPEDEDGAMTEADRRAWIAATERFRARGSWVGGFSTCTTCGCVVIPGGGGDRCEAHAER